MDFQQTNPAPSSVPGPVIGIIVIVVVLLVGAFYFFSQFAAPLQQTDEATQTPETTELVVPAEPTDVTDIEAELQGDDFSDLDAELDAIEQELAQ